MNHLFLVGGFNPLKNMTSSVGIMIPNVWKKHEKKNVPNRQPNLNSLLNLLLGSAREVTA